MNFKETDLIGLQAHDFYSIKQVNCLKSVGNFINKIELHRGFQKENQGAYEIKLKGPVIYLIGPYKISGRVLILPIQGEGKSNITLGNVDFNRNIPQQFND